MNRSLRIRIGYRRSRFLMLWKMRWRHSVVMPFFSFLENMLGVRIITPESQKKSLLISHETFVLNALRPGDYDPRAAQQGRERHWVEEFKLIDLGKKFDLPTHTMRSTLNDLIRKGIIITSVSSGSQADFRVYAINIVDTKRTQR